MTLSSAFLLGFIAGFVVWTVVSALAFVSLAKKPHQRAPDWDEFRW